MAGGQKVTSITLLSDCRRLVAVLSVLSAKGVERVGGVETRQ